MVRSGLRTSTSTLSSAPIPNIYTDVRSQTDQIHKKIVFIMQFPSCCLVVAFVLLYFSSFGVFFHHHRSMLYPPGFSIYILYIFFEIAANAQILYINTFSTSLFFTRSENTKNVFPPPAKVYFISPAKIRNFPVTPHAASSFNICTHTIAVSLACKNFF